MGVVRHLRALVEGGRGTLLAAVLVVLAVVGVPVLAKTGVKRPGRKKDPDRSQSSARPEGGRRAGHRRGGRGQGVVAHVVAHDGDCRSTAPGSDGRPGLPVATADYVADRHLRLRRPRPKRRGARRRVGWRGQKLHPPTIPGPQRGATAGNSVLQPATPQLRVPATPGRLEAGSGVLWLPTTTRRRVPATPSRPWEVTSCISNLPGASCPGRATAVVRGEPFPRL